MKVITFTNKKGGVGKTTHAAHCAADMALRHRIGIIDAGPQGDVSTVLGLLPTDSLYSVMVEDHPINDEVVTQVHPEVYATPDDNPQGALYLLPGWDMTSEIGTHLVKDFDGGFFKFINVCKDFAAAYDLDYIFVDTQPTRTSLDGAIWAATDGWVYVTGMGALSFKGLQSVIDRFHEFGQYRMEQMGRESRVLAIIPNRVRSNVSLHQGNLGALAQEYGVFKQGGLVMAPCRLLIAWQEAMQFENRTVFAYAPSSEAALDGRRVAQGIEGRLLAWQEASAI